MDTSDAERGLARIEQGAKKMATSAGKAAAEAGKAIDSIGNGAGDSAQKFTRAESQIRREIEKSTLALKTMGQAASKRIETTIDFKGLDRAKFEPYLAQLREAERLQDQVSRSMGNMGASAEGAKDSFLALARTGVAAFLGSQVVQGAKRAASALYEASAAGERLRTTLDFATGNSAREMTYLTDLAARYGLRLNDTAKAYASFAAAARGTALEGQKTRDVFESISKASAVMGLTSEQSAGALLALQQMVSKGTVQAEELRGQLGERLPGAFQVAAKAMGVTTQELGKMLEQGQVVADDFLPKFAAALNEHIGDASERAADRLDAAVNRLDNAWEMLKRNIGDSGVSAAMSREMSALGGDITAVSDAISQATRDGDASFLALAKGAGVAAGRSGLGALALSANTLNSVINGLTGGVLGLRTDINLLPAAFMTSAAQADALAVDIAAAEKELVRLKELDTMPMNGNYFRDGIAKTQAWIDKLKEARRELLGLSGESAGRETYSVGSGDAALARAKRAIYDQQVAARDALLEKYATPQEKLNEAIASAKASLGDLYSPEIERRITEHFIKPTKSAAKSAKEARDEFGELMNRLSSKDAGLSPNFNKELDTLYKGYQQGRIGVDEYRDAVEKLIQTQPFAIDALREQAAAEREAQKAREQLVQAQERSAANVEQQVQKLRDEEEALAISAAMNISLAQALETVAMARLEEAKAKEIAKGKDADQAVIAAIEKEIAARKELATLMAKKEVRDANKKAAEDAAKEWERTSNEISQALTDALMRGFEEGKSFGENFADSLGNSIKTAVARALQQALAKNISAMFGGQGGFNWSSLFSGNNWASTIGSALGYGSTAGAGAGTLTYANAVGAMGGDSLGALAAANNQWAGVAASASEAAAASQSAASASSAAAGAWASWAAVALATSSNMYKAGWNKDAMTEGAIATHRFGRFSSTTGQSQYTSTGLLSETANVITEKINMGILKAVGVSDKWAQILSGVPLTAGLWGRKLKGYGYDVDIAGGAVDVGGYEYHKGGLFRSNKTIEFDVDSRDAEELRRQVEAVRDSSAAMAKALGYSDEAIDSFTGNLRINFKGAETAEEQAERYNDALADLNRQMINAATGANYTKEQFDAMMSGIQEDMAAVGISAEGIADIIVQGMMGKLSQQEVGDALADMMVGGIYESIASNYAGQIAQAFTGQILTPIFTAIAAGVPLSQAISQQAISNVVATAQSAAAAMNAIFSNAEFQAAIAGIQQAIGGVAGAVTKVKIPSFGSARTSASNAAAQKAQQQAQERYNLETKLLQLLGKTDILRQRELASINAANRGLQQHIWAVEDATDSVNNAMAALERAVAAERDRLQEQLDAAMESERALNDVFGVLRDNIRDLRGEVEYTSQIDAAAGRDLIQQAIAGTKFDADELADAIDAVRHSIEKGNYATRFDQERAQLKLAAELSLLSDVTESELSAAEQQIALLEDQLNGLDVQLDLAQQQVDALFGVDTSVKSVAAAVAALGDAMGGYSAAIAAAAAQSFSTGAAPSGGSSSGSSYRVSGGGSSSKQWTAQGYWDKNPDLQREFIDKNLAASPDFNKDPNLSARDEYLRWHWNTHGQKEKRKYARGGYYPGGLALVGEEGPELINFRQPGQVYTAMQTQNLLAGDGEVSRLLRQLIEETRSNAAAVVKRQVDLNKIVSRWDRDGMPEERDVTT